VKIGSKMAARYIASKGDVQEETMMLFGPGSLVACCASDLGQLVRCDMIMRQIDAPSPHTLNL